MPSGSGGEDFPPLLPPMTDAMRIDLLQHQTGSLSEDLKGLRQLSLGWCAREIWKWIVKKRGVESGDAKHLYYPDVQHLVVRVATALGMQHRISEVQEMSRTCILPRNDAAHFSSLEALEGAVKSSELAMKVFPTLQESHPHQCTTVAHYWRFKQLLSESFKDT